MGLPTVTRPPGIYVTPAYQNDFSNLPTSDLQLLIWVGSVVGSPTLDCVLQTSMDGVSWTDVPGSAIAQMTEPGNTTCNAAVSSGVYVQASTVVGGSADSRIAYRVLALIFGLTG